MSHEYHFRCHDCGEDCEAVVNRIGEELAEYARTASRAILAIGSIVWDSTIEPKFLFARVGPETAEALWQFVRRHHEHSLFVDSEYDEPSILV